MKKATISTLLSALVILLSVNSIHAQGKKDDFNIPADLGKADCLVLVAPGTKDKITEEVLEAFADNYKGKYEAAPNANPKNTKEYQDKHRFVFFIREHLNPATTIGRDRFPATTDYKFGLMDTRTNKSYEQDFWSGSYKKGAKNYIKKMEEIRKANAGE